MDRSGPRLIRGVAAAGVSLFVVAGAAFAANAVMGAPRSAARDLVPAAASSPSDASKVEATEKAEATETAEPTESPKATAGTAKPAKTAELGEKSEGTERAEASETPEPTRSPKATQTPDPTETPDAEGRSTDDHGQSGQHDGARAFPVAGATTSRSRGTSAPIRVHRHDGGNGSDNSDG